MSNGYHESGQTQITIRKKECGVQIPGSGSPVPASLPLPDTPSSSRKESTCNEKLTSLGGIFLKIQDKKIGNRAWESWPKLCCFCVGGVGTYNIFTHIYFFPGAFIFPAGSHKTGKTLTECLQQGLVTSTGRYLQTKARCSSGKYKY